LMCSSSRPEAAEIWQAGEVEGDGRKRLLLAKMSAEEDCQ